jgi:hypothetical protein
MERRYEEFQPSLPHEVALPVGKVGEISIEAVEILSELGKCAVFLEVRQICFRPQGRTAFSESDLSKVPIDKLLAFCSSREVKERVESWIPPFLASEAERGWQSFHRHKVPEGVVVYALLGNRAELGMAEATIFF